MKAQIRDRSYHSNALYMLYASAIINEIIEMLQNARNVYTMYKYIFFFSDEHKNEAL